MVVAILDCFDLNIIYIPVYNMKIIKFERY